MKTTSHIRFLCSALARVVGVALLAATGIVLCAVLFGCTAANFDVAPGDENGDNDAIGLAKDGGGGADALEGDAESDAVAAETQADIIDTGVVPSTDTGSAIDSGSATDSGAVTTDSGAVTTDSGSAPDTAPPIDTGCTTDFDKDGFISAACPGGTDCDDSDKNVYPGQEQYFAYVSKGGTWDFNCSKTIEKLDVTPAACTFDGTKCNVTQGWINVIPECGKSGDWLMYATHTGSGTSCVFTTETRIMKCR